MMRAIGSLGLGSFARGWSRLSRFSVGLSTGFFLSLTLLPLITQAWKADRLRADASLLGYLPPEWYDPSTRTPAEAERRREFWLAETDWAPRGVALRLLENRSLLESFFPGYGDSANDPRLWDIYFRDDTVGWSPIRSPLTVFGGVEQYSIRARLFGAMELFARYGADVIVLGSSKTFCAVIPRLLAEAVRGPAGPDPKVLLIGKDAFFVPGYSRVARALSRRIQHRARLAIVTVSWSDWRDKTWELRDRFERFAKGDDPSPAPRMLRPLLDWYAGIGIDLFQHLGRDGSPWLRVGEGSFVLPSDNLGRALALFPRAGEKDPAVVRQVSSKAFSLALSRPHQESEVSFDLIRSREAIERKIASARLLADRILLFFPPEPPAAGKAYPPGYLAAFRKMLSGLAARDVGVVEEDYSSYGLNPLDHVHAGWTADWAYWQSDHLNYEGARKVTERLGQLARKALQ